ncbi:hypothetical protein CIL05_03360 [Virgibacillus profundi]|uniref:Chromosome segregation ATPase n=1 Tax=Virgibacillus profundi TaxID=2024555 RepID=A0A2A2IHP7_9BACI|nr:hypothetical protein [Virgibacillus profundi]PAV30774.1 hypothetical protein CIL05_03360 [Virgibacillus profundi]PXY54957.1 hypothetical protein CIT14_03440 [Virgibacillus profundi]
MPAISKIRLTNIVYEGGEKRFNDETFLLDGNNGAILLENGGGKTVFIHTLLQAILPHTPLGDRKIKETLQLENAPAHIGIEWIINERPRRYMTTAVSLFLYNNKLDSYRYVFEYEANNPNSLEQMPFVKDTTDGNKRPAYKEEVVEYYSAMKSKTHNARTFDTIGTFNTYIEEQYQIITNEWESIVKINRDEGGIEKFFENCRTTTDLYDRLLIPTVEDSIAGHEQGMFADMFEKQREGFQTYRNLQKSMKEHKAIQTELEKYVAEFEEFSNKQIVYETTKQRAKGLAQEINNQRSEMDKAYAENEMDWKRWRDEDLEYNIKTASYEISQEQEKARTLEAEHMKKLAAYEEETEHLRENQRLSNSLEHAKYKQELQSYEQLLAQYKAELEQHDQQGEVLDYETELEIENAKLHGYFSSMLEQIEGVIEQLETERRPTIEAIEELNISAAKQSKQLEEVKQEDNHTQGQLSTKQDQLEKLKQQILANPDQESVQAEYENWNERHQWLDEEIIRLKQFKKASEQKVTELDQQREALNEQLNDKKMSLRDKKYDEQTMQKAHDALIDKLGEIRPSWKAITNLHLKENSVYSPLIDLQGKLTREREDIMYKERLARYFVDNYDEQKTFFTDTFLAEKLAEWQNQFYVVTGPEFFADLNDDQKTAFAEYPLWPLTLISTEADQEKVITKLTEIKARLQYPISVLTLEEVKRIGIGNSSVKEKWVAPTHWQTNLDEEYFMTWKKDVRKVAEELTALREQKEAELNNCQAIIGEFESFFHTYPVSFKELLMENIRNIEAEIESNGREINKLRILLNQVKDEIKVSETHVNKYTDEKDGLGRRLEKAVELFQVEREITELKEALRRTREKIAQLEKEERQLKRELSSYEADKRTINELISGNQDEIRITKADSVYNEVKGFQPQYTDDAKSVIMERRKSLQLKIHGIQQSYGEIVEKHKQTEKDIVRVKAEIKDILNEHEEIDAGMVFPADGKRLLERIRTNVKTGEAKTKELSEILTKAKESVAGQNSRVDTKLEQFQVTFSNIPLFKFDMELETIAAYLEKTQQNLMERKIYLQAEKERIEKQLSNIEKAHHNLDRFAEAHHFNRTNITAFALTAKEITEFSYERLKFVTEITNVLRSANETLEVAKDKIDRAKGHFRRFCRDNITERKLREMATEGIEIKKTLEDVLGFQQNMLTTVERADQYARNYISEKDKEVQAFINSIHNHLLNVTEQLRVIPKKTKVKIGEKWREIFQFSIPEWVEEDGKSRIRDHMDWILEQLESDHFKNDQGIEDNGKVRKEVETWLHTKQLLQVVMDHKGMKVACRKVTNDNQVTQKLTSWEQSNKWSGGEKWSKNMTLFLGILNFVAEKKQHIETKMKRHRAVILDNPFGKASSDHVLSPVFFVAEQLGFQIIALTAHADGKYLQDYFPIIYSLKLRATANKTKQIMTKEKSLHHAYFQDHEPEEMKRLEEREQLELF